MLSEGKPAAGRRVRQVRAEWAKTNIYHSLYLPCDWKPGQRYPVIVEYAGNGDYQNEYGDFSTGKVEDCSLGYGISGGRRFIWVCLPFVDPMNKQNATLWWGDVNATVDYCRKTVTHICERYGGDTTAVFLAGFSRGGIACNYIGLHDALIAKLWAGFIALSHYDGTRETWPYAGADRAAALTRLRRLKGRPVLICQEQSTLATRHYLEATGIHTPFTFLDLSYPNHTDTWVLRNVPERRLLRKWVQTVLNTRKT